MSSVCQRSGGQAVRRSLLLGAITCAILTLVAFRPAGRPTAIGATQLSYSPSDRPQDPVTIISRSADKYGKLSSFRADFRQTIADSMIGTYDSEGKLLQQGEARLSMRFTDPRGDAIVMDGEHLWVYTPSTTPGQVLRMKVPNDPTYGPNVLAWILTDPAKRYNIRYVKSDAVAGRAADVLALTPIDRTLPFSEAIVWLDQYDYLPRRLEIREKGGTRRTLVLSSVETNRRVGTDAFVFAVPSGVRVIDQ
jgi:outer membrane lipoprotein carrier protein